MCSLAGDTKKAKIVSQRWWDLTGMKIFAKTAGLIAPHLLSIRDIVKVYLTSTNVKLERSTESVLHLLGQVLLQICFVYLAPHTHSHPLSLSLEAAPWNILNYAVCMIYLESRPWLWMFGPSTVNCALSNNLLLATIFFLVILRSSTATNFTPLRQVLCDAIQLEFRRGWI